MSFTTYAEHDMFTPSMSLASAATPTLETLRNTCQGHPRILNNPGVNFGSPMATTMRRHAVSTSASLGKKIKPARTNATPHHTTPHHTTPHHTTPHHTISALHSWNLCRASVRSVKYYTNMIAIRGKSKPGGFH